jgi:hypothetical protein
MRPRPALWRPRTVVLVIGFVAALGACSGQGEGERCDTRASGTPAGTSDCSGDLTCQMRPGFNTADHGGICCPPDLSQATTAACSPNAGSFDANPSPPDASTEDSPTEAGSELGPEPSEEAAADGGVDAVAE